MPFALQAGYKHGYINTMREAMRLSERQVVIAAGKVVLFREAAGQTALSNWAAAELGSILNVLRLWNASVEARAGIGRIGER